MIIDIPISIGEFLDKISILLIKEKKIKNEKKLTLVNQELVLLKKSLNTLNNLNELNSYIDKLVAVNTQLWQIEDKIREYERKKIFDQNFINLARSVYITNDKRSKIKLEINNIFGSEIIEVKNFQQPRTFYRI